MICVSKLLPAPEPTTLCACVSSHTAAWFATLTRSPAYRAELHLVAETPDGAFASFVGVTYDPENRRGIVEPVCTDPAHRRINPDVDRMIDHLVRVARDEGAGG